MNAITEVPAVSAQTLEHVLGTGDLSKLTVPQRVEYYARTCQSLGLNPLTRPFRFLALNGQIQLYATKDCTDQLRSLHGITLHLVDKSIDGELFIVTARARNKDGREDEDIGAVSLINVKGESRANALMKGTTKAKRRVTLSICGLGGMPDESELDGMPGAKTFDAEDEAPVAPLRAVAATGKPRRSAEGEDADRAEAAERERAAAAATPRPERKVDPTVYETATPAAPQRKSWSQWADALEVANCDAGNDELGRMIAKAEVAEIYRLAQEGDQTPAKKRIVEAYRSIEERYLADPPEPDLSDEALGEVQVEGEAKVAAG